MIRFVLKHWILPFMVEYIHSLIHVLKDASFHTYDTDDELKNIMLLDGVHVFLQTPPEHIKKHVYVINTEQAFRSEIKQEITRDALLFRRGLCDYGPNNISIMKKYLPYPVDIHHLPYQFNPSEIRDVEKSMDCVFVVGGGWSPGERRRILAERIPTMTILGGDRIVFGQDRDDLLFKHKVLVNVHSKGELRTHEAMRTFRCVFNKMIVVTEKSDDDDSNLLRKHMIIVDYEEIPKVVETVLANYSEYYKCLFETPEFEEAKEALKLPLLEFKRTVGF